MTTEKEANEIYKSATKQHPAYGIHLHQTIKTKAIPKSNTNRNAWIFVSVMAVLAVISVWSVYVVVFGG